MVWTDTKNERRCHLIDKEIDADISDAERAELAALQNEMLEYRRLVAPLPLEETRQLYKQLLQRNDG